MLRLGMKLGKGKKSHLVKILSHVLNELCNQEYPSNIKGNICTSFDSIDPPPIKLTCYLKRIATFTRCSEESLILSLIYIDRLITNPERKFLVTALNVHRLILSSVLVAVKFYDDWYYDNVFFSKVGGVSSKELNILETEFLFLINFDLSVDSEMFLRYNKRLMRCPTPFSYQVKLSSPTKLKNVEEKLVPSQPLTNKFVISNTVYVEVGINPKHTTSPSPIDSIRCNLDYIRTNVKNDGNQINKAHKCGKLDLQLQCESTSFVQRRCSDVALFPKLPEMEPINVLPTQ